MVDRLLIDHFEDFSKVQTDVMTIEGKTLRQTLLHTKRELKGTDKRMCTQLFDELKKKFALATAPTKKLKVTDNNELIQPALLEALDASRMKNPAKRTKQPLYNFFASVKQINQKELVGLLRSISEVRVSSSVPARKHCLEVIKFLVNSGLHQKFRQEMGILRELFDETLALTFACMQKEHMPIATWWQNFSQYVKILGSISDFEAIMSETRGWSFVNTELMRAVTCSKLAQKMFGGAASLVLADGFSSAVDAKLQELKRGEMTVETIMACKD
jgi:hypothetical protein